MSFKIFFTNRLTYFFLAVATVFVAAFFILQRIEEFNLLAAPLSDEQKISGRRLDVLFVGDTMMDRMVRNIINREGTGYPFSKIMGFVGKHDISVLNLEGVFTDYDSVSVRNMDILQFTFDPKHVESLKEAGFTAVGQANNHTNDFGREGLVSSKKYLTNSGLSVFGDFFNEGEPMYLRSNGQKIAVIGFNEFSNRNFERIEAQISDAKSQGYFTVIMPHWGTEYERFPNESQMQKAHKWIELGADAIIGAHPHVIQTLEEYEGKPIFYSLGNFIFDQSFSQETQEAIAVSLRLSDTEASFKVTPISLYKAQPQVMESVDATAILESLARDSDIPDKNKDDLKLGRSMKFAR